MKTVLNDVLTHELQVNAAISDRNFEDLVHHWARDMQQLERDNRDGVDPSKIYGYFGFWVRKLKPIYQAFRILDADDEVGDNPEIEDINEQAAIYMAIRGVARAAYESGRTRQEGERRRTAIRKFVRAYLTEPSGAYPGSNYATLVYDMRYRTFGPHHIAHLLKWAQTSGLRRAANRPPK